MPSIKFTLFIICLLCISVQQGFSKMDGTVSNEFGRISNQPNNRIHVAAALTLSDCIRLCVDFSSQHREYFREDCFAYNYDLDNFTCELIHSSAVLNYRVDIQPRWKNGLKY